MVWWTVRTGSSRSGREVRRVAAIVSKAWSACTACRADDAPGTTEERERSHTFGWWQLLIWELIWGQVMQPISKGNKQEKPKFSRSPHKPSENRKQALVCRSLCSPQKTTCLPCVSEQWGASHSSMAPPLQKITTLYFSESSKGSQEALFHHNFSISQFPNPSWNHGAKPIAARCPYKWHDKPSRQGMKVKKQDNIKELSRKII